MKITELMFWELFDFRHKEAEIVITGKVVINSKP